MLRALIILMLLANLAFWAWHQQDVAQALGLPRHSDREPERLQRQVAPNTVRLVAAAGPGPGVAPCMQTDAMSPAAALAVTRALRAAGLPADAWSEVRRETGGRWAVVLGQGDTPARLQRRLGQLEALALTGLTPELSAEYLSLGRYTSVEAAERQLAVWRGQGLQGAQVLELEAPRTEVRLRADALDAARWGAIKSALPADAPAWTPCAP